MVIYPETQKRAQAELDVVVGRHRIPTFADYENLLYIRAMVKEALRWRPVDPVGLPHRSIEDDWYEVTSSPLEQSSSQTSGTSTETPRFMEQMLYTSILHAILTGRARSLRGRWARRKKVTSRGKPLLIDVDGCVEDGLVVYGLRLLERDGFTDVFRKDNRQPIPFKVNITPRFSEAETMLELERKSHGLPASQQKE
ncbi:hypothetical protein OG21DRAFT_1501333 [Imleria badia]|nr:hypothetical protein OG21DRAFT_1501333 [Imleria badia]